MFPLLLAQRALQIGCEKAGVPHSHQPSATMAKPDNTGSFALSRVIDADQLSTEKTKSVSSGKFCDLAKGLAKSKILRALAFSAVAVGTLFLLVSNPVGWLIAVVAIGAFVVSLLAQLPFWKGKQMLAFEVSAFSRLIKGKNYSPIDYTSQHTSTPNFKLFLGALPNRLTNDGEHLANKENVGAVLSINEPWERKPVGVSLPHNAKDWEDLDVTYRKFNVLDHTFLSSDELNAAADFINGQRLRGVNVYVHCRAGVGRSAMAVAAYLIKYEGMSIITAMDVILNSRSKSTIANKLPGLEDFARKILNGTYKLDPVERNPKDAN